MNWSAPLAASEKSSASTAQSAEGLDFWSLRPIQRPPLPKVEGTDPPWVRTPIDAFVIAKLREKGLSPSSAADRRTLIRRLCFDIIGLPPKPEEVDSFIRDDDPLGGRDKSGS